MVAAEIIGIAGLMPALARWGRDRRTALLALYVVLLAACLALNTILIEAPAEAWRQSPQTLLWLPVVVVAAIALFLVDFSIHSIREADVLVVDMRYLLASAPPSGAFGISIVVAILEEALFRWQLLESLGPGVPFFILTAAAFGAVHLVFGTYDAFSKAALGLACGIVLVLTGSVVLSIVFHLTYNWLALADRSAAGSTEHGARPSLEPVGEAGRKPKLEEVRALTGIEVSGLRKSYGGKDVLSDIDLQIREPGLYLLAGPNGSGKTTLLEILVGLRAADEGSVRIGGHDPGDIDLRRHVGFLAQQNSLRKNSTVLEEAQLVRELYSLDVDIPAYLARYDLDSYLRQRTKSLSGGTKRRLLIAMQLMPEYDTIILDEPASGLDTSSRDEIWNSLREYAAKKVVLVSDHYLNEAAQYSDHVFLINDGRIVLRGRTRELLEGFGMRFVLKARAEHAEALRAKVVEIAPQYEVRSSGTVFNIFFNADDERVARLSLAERGEHTVHPVNLEDVYFYYTGDVFGDEVRRGA